MSGTGGTGDSSELPWRQEGDTVWLEILVSPRASRDKWGPIHNGRIKLFITAPPVDGEANDAVVRFLAKLFGVPARDVSIEKGQTGRQKRVRLVGASLATIEKL